MLQKRYFNNLNGVRFIAAFTVLFHHVEQAKYASHLDNIYQSELVQHCGRLGVGLFFVLSGFLITYLLLQEKHNHGDIASGKFYLRRIFRIWPIYFIVVLSSYFLFPEIALFKVANQEQLFESNYWQRLGLLILVLPNYAFMFYELPYLCSQAWSIGVEEQFYYLWPWLIKYPRRKWGILALFLTIALGFFALGLYSLDIPYEKKVEKIIPFFGQFRIQIMALGGLMAYLVFYEKTRILNFLFRKDIQIAVYTILLVCFFSGVHFPGFMEFYGLFFAFFILNVSCNPNTIINLNWGFMDYLGRISYGLYLYHIIVIIFLINLAEFYFPELPTLQFNIYLYVGSILGTILVSGLSFRFIEKPLLDFKDKRYGR